MKADIHVSIYALHKQISFFIMHLCKYNSILEV